MKNKLLVTMGLVAALMVTGCAGSTGTGAQADTDTQAQEAQSEETAEAEAGQETAEAGQETEAEANTAEAEANADAGAEQETASEIVKYESDEGWSVSYNEAEFEVNEDDGTYFHYIGQADGVNQICVTYYTDMMPDAVLYEAMADENGLPEHTRSEGYFAGRTDVWSIRTQMASYSVPNATDEFIAVERNGGTLLVQVTTTKQADEATDLKVSDALASVVDSFELKDQQPQTYSAYVPGKYVAEVTDEIDGKDITVEYYVQFNEDHTGVVSMQDDMNVIWYSREGKVLNAETGEQVYEYTVEGDGLYLRDVTQGNMEDAPFFEFKKAEETAEATESTEAADTAEAAKPAEAESSAVDYSDENNWVYYGVGDDKDVDLFLVCPTVDTLDEENMSLDNEVMLGYFKGALEMERGLYEESAKMYAPYYRQMAMGGYKIEEAERERRLQFAYKDVSDAFKYYLENENDGRPIILAGFSQGSDMVYRLMEEYFGDEEMQEKLVAAYAIGWACTEDMVKEYPQIKPAQSADDLGVVISFDCEAPEVTETIVNPAGRKAYSINPLNWKTDSTPADKSENDGACFFKATGELKSEAENLCGCYIDEERGALKVTDVSPADYPARIDIFPDGAYHIYDYQFFFMNLKENVQHRVELYMEQAAAADQAA